MFPTTFKVRNSYHLYQRLTRTWLIRLICFSIQLRTCPLDILSLLEQRTLQEMKNNQDQLVNSLHKAQISGLRFRHHLRNHRTVWKINSGAKGEAICIFQGELMHKDLVFTERYVYIMVTKSHRKGHNSLCYSWSMLHIKGEQFQTFPCSTELHKASF